MALTGDGSRSWKEVRPSPAAARGYRELGFWRNVTPAADLRRWARQTPDAIAVTAHRAGAGVQRITYREYAERVERVTTVLAELGIGPGDVVAVQLPNWWQLNAVVLACARLGAIVAPFVTTIRARELELMLARLEPVAYVTTETWDGYQHSAALAAIAGRLPAIKHRIIVGGRVAPGEIDLDKRAERAAAEPGTGAAAEDPDRVSVVLFTSGTTGSPKAVLHTFNTFFASDRMTAVRSALSTADVLYLPHAMAHVLGQHTANMLPLYLGAQALIADVWDPETVTGLLAEYEATYVIGAPVFIEAIAQAARLGKRQLPRLQQVIATATTIPASLVGTVSDDFGVTLQSAWGMTEVGAASVTSSGQDPPGWAVHSIGRMYDSVQVSLRADGEVSPHNPAGLFVRGPSVCLATVPRDGGAVNVLAESGDGWYDTGDLVIPDGRGGLRMAGRAVDRIGGALMIPVADVEDVLRRHPDVVDAALVGYGPGYELPCAVVVSRSPVTLEQLRTYLDGIGMTEWYQPRRLELVERLPRNATGKVDKHQLRTWLASLDKAGQDPVGAAAQRY